MGRNRRLSDYNKVPVLNKPRSAFKIEDKNTTTMNTGELVPFFKKEINPGDTFNSMLSVFGRLTTQIVPTLDDLYLKTYFFFVPYRILWEHWVNMHGERKNPTDSIDYACPTITAPENGFTTGSTFDYMNCPIGIGGIKVNALPFRAINKIYNHFFRDENLINSAVERYGDTGDLYTDYPMFKKCKIHDYFTSCLPAPQKGDGVSLPLGTTAPVYGTGMTLGLTNGTTPFGLFESGGYMVTSDNSYGKDAGTSTLGSEVKAGKSIGITTDKTKSGIIADLSNATAATIDSLNTAIRLQSLLQLDNRGGTRYCELLQAHFSVTNPDSRLQQPEYLGGTTTRVNINGVLQTSATQENGTPLGDLAGHGIVGTVNKVINKSFTEYGIIIGLACICSKPSYQQGLERIYSRSTRYDYFYPIFNGLPEQEVLNKEIYCQGTDDDDGVFGYQERYAEYKNGIRAITGKMRSTATNSLDYWHFAEEFDNLPQLNKEFIEENIPIERALAVQDEPPFLMDFEVDSIAYREMPIYNIPTIGSLMR